MNVIEALGATIRHDVAAIVRRFEEQAPAHLPWHAGEDAVESVPVSPFMRQRRRDETITVSPPMAARDVPFGMPVDGIVSSVFGRRRHPLRGRVQPHWGEDIAAAEGAPVTATAAGVVIFAGAYGGYGNLVAIDHGNGLVTRYGHLSAIAVDTATRVARGEVIGAVGQTGLATGPHLHYEVLEHNRFQNPSRYMARVH